ncbi:MAG: AraC family transcriptional regulator [Eubacteriales bacterium]|nr:AraC family transcriptional regulator [Eubacteriales bacterium]
MIPFHDYSSITTDDTLRETLQHGNCAYPFAYYLEDIMQFDFHCADWHWHHELEFLSVAKGTALCLVGEDKFELPEGCGLFVNSSVLHRYEATDTAIVPNILFAPSLLAPEKSLLYEKYVHPVITSSSPYQIFDPKIEWQHQILQILDTIYALQEDDDRKELHTVQYLLQLWDILSAHFERSSESGGFRRVNHRQARLQLMMQYIHDHYSEPITLEEIAAAAAISKSGALDIFQTGIHLPPVSYLIQYRLTRAAELLHTTEKTVSAIAKETGFSSAGYFCRKFKERYRISPQEYRKEKLGIE